jgi:hypothetical protein
LQQKKFTLYIVLALGFFLAKLNGQVILTASGGFASGSEGTVCYSIGQVFYSSQSGTNGSITEGVQQPYEIYVVNEIEEAREINLILSVYPNPTTCHIILKVDASTVRSFQSLSYQLFTLDGRLLENKKIEEIETSIVISNLMPETYLLKVINGNKELKIFKIIKY